MRKNSQNKKYSKVKRKLDTLYPEYKNLNETKEVLTKDERKRLDLLITIISNLEAKWITRLKSKNESKKL